MNILTKLIRVEDEFVVPSAGDSLPLGPARKRPIETPKVYSKRLGEAQFRQGTSGGQVYAPSQADQTAANVERAKKLWRKATGGGGANGLEETAAGGACLTRRFQVGDIVEVYYEKLTVWNGLGKVMDIWADTGVLSMQMLTGPSKGIFTANSQKICRLIESSGNIPPGHAPNGV